MMAHGILNGADAVLVIHVGPGKMPPVRRRYRFSGHVQFVGFRYEAKMTADQLNLTGWAQNQGDGTVLVELEGEEARIDEFLRVMQEVPRFEIAEIRAEDLPLSGAEPSFEVIC